MDTEPPVAQAGPAPRVEPVLPAPPPASRIPAPPEYIAFFKASYKEVVRAARYVGATAHEADDAAAKAMQEVLLRWGKIDKPLPYARRAAINYFIKDKTRGTERVFRRMVDQLAYPDLEGEDPNLSGWENREWLLQLLDLLPDGQRTVMALVIDGFEPTEIAARLGKTPEAVRQSLHAARTRLQHHRQEQQASQGAERPASSPTKEARR